MGWRNREIRGNRGPAISRFWGPQFLTDTIHQFLTFENSSPRTSGLVVDRRGRDKRLTEEDVQILRMAADGGQSVCAFGKIALLTDNGIETFQVTAEGKLTAAFCGNSTAAAVAHSGNDLRGPVRVKGPACETYEVTARIADGAVHQTWLVPDSPPTHLVWNGCRTILLHCLNDYAIIEGSLPEGITPEQARGELFGDQTGAKVAIIRGSQSHPEVEFHNSNGRHGAAPQTGLASIALAARYGGWLADRLSSGMVSFQADGETRCVALPTIIAESTQRLQFEMSPIRVALSPVTRILAA